MTETDIEFLKEYITRLTHELLLCQGNHEKDLSHYQPKVELPLCFFSESMIAPLFFSYDMRIEELQTVIEQQGTYLDLITQRLNYVLIENEKLRNTHTDCLRTHGLNYGDKEISVSIKNESLRGDNELLIQQAELLVKELECSNSALSDREKTIEALSLDLENKIKLISDCEEKSNQLMKKHSIAEHHRQLLQHDLSKEKRSVEALKVKVMDLQSNDSRKAAVLHSTLVENQEYELEAVELSQRVRK